MYGQNHIKNAVKSKIYSWQTEKLRLLHTCLMLFPLSTHRQSHLSRFYRVL